MDTQSKWTPGPWRARLSEEYWIVCGAEGRTIADGSNAEVPWAASNAHLIAAAPEMYEALAALHEYADKGTRSWDEVDALAIAALRKARGERE